MSYNSINKTTITCQILIVNYGQWKATLDFVRSLKDQSLHITVLDNFFSSSCRDENSKLIREIESLNAEIIEFERNLGYFGAPIEYLKKNKSSFDWTIIANNDLLHSRGFILDEIVSLSALDSEIWSIAPSIKEIGGRELNPYFKGPLSRNKKVLFRIYYLNYWLALIILGFRKFLLPSKLEVANYGEYIYAQNGAMFILKKELINDLIIEDTLSFLYGEEILISELLNRRLKKIYFSGSLSFKHIHSLSTGEGLSRAKFKWMKNAYKSSIKKGYNFYT